MKINKSRLLNILLIGSITANAVMLIGLGFIAKIEYRVHDLRAAIKTPVFIYVGKTSEAGSEKAPASEAK